MRSVLVVATLTPPDARAVDGSRALVMNYAPTDPCPATTEALGISHACALGDEHGDRTHRCGCGHEWRGPRVELWQPRVVPGALVEAFG